MATNTMRTTMVRSTDSKSTIWSSLSTRKRLNLQVKDFVEKCPDSTMKNYKAKYDRTTSIKSRKFWCDKMYSYLMSVQFRSLREEGKEEGKRVTITETVFDFYRFKFDEKAKTDNPLMLHESFSFRDVILGVAIPSKRWMSLITAYCQGGKTFLVIGAMAMYLALGMTPVIIVKDRGQKKQLWSRLCKDLTDLRKYLKSKGFSNDEISIFEEPIYYDSHCSGNAKKYCETKLKPALDGTKRRIIIAIKHAAHLERITSCTHMNSNIALFVDEAHILGGYKYLGDGSGTDLHDSSVHYDRELFKLKDRTHCKKYVAITATAQTLLISDPNLYPRGVINIPSHMHHRGLHDYIFHTNFHKEDEEYEACEDEDGYNWPMSLKSVLAKLSVEPPYERTNKFGVNDKLAIHLLCKHEPKCAEQHKLLQACKTDTRPYDNDHRTIIAGDWAVMTVQEEGIRLYHSSLKGERITINGEIARDNGCGEFLFKGVEICDVWQYLEMNGGVERFPRRVVIAFNSVEEGITFGGHYTNDPATDKNLHLTDLYIKMNERSPGCRLRQSMMRGAGNHGDDMKINMYCSMKNKLNLIKSFEIHDKQIKFLCGLSRDHDNKSVSSAIQGHELFSNQLPTKYIKVRGGDKKLKRKENPNAEEEEKSLKKFCWGYTLLRKMDPAKYPVKMVPYEVRKIKAARKKRRLKETKKIEEEYEEKVDYEYEYDDEEESEDSESDEEVEEKKTFNKIHKILGGSKNTKISIFLSLIDVDKIYTRGEIETLLHKANYDQPKSIFTSITSLNSTWGPGTLFKKIGSNWKIVESLKSAWL